MNRSHINWYPGHMEKGKRQVENQIDMVDVVLELVDARLPLASRNPEIEKITKQKPRLILLNKADLADPSVTDLWLQWFASQGEQALAVSGTTGAGLRALPQLVKPLASEALERWQRRGRRARPVRLMTVGIPNVGKSSLINRLIGRKKAATQDKPGLTRKSQWVKIRGDMDLLDMPGILMPKIQDQNVGKKLAATGAISDSVFDLEEVARYLALWLGENYPSALINRYGLSEPLPNKGDNLILTIGEKRGFLLTGEKIDTLRTSQVLLDEFRGGRLGKISLEKPPKGK